MELPMLIRTNQQKCADHFALKLAQGMKIHFEFASIQTDDIMAQLEVHDDRDLLYISGFELLKKSQRRELIERIQGMNVILSTTEAEAGEEDAELKTLSLKSDVKTYEDGEILSIEEYVKHILTTHQHKYPDTELSKKLGISRKSLWEKRKKYGILKKNSKK